MTYKEAISLIHEGNCLLVLGSGFSADALNCKGTNVPRASELVERLDEVSGEDSEGDLAISAENFIDAKGEVALIDFLKDELTPVKITDAQKIIAQLPWRRVYTTNYDDIIENGARIAGTRVEGVTLSHKTSVYRNKRNLVVHLNGKLSELNQDTLNDEFKLTNVSYLTTSFTDSSWWKDIFIYDLKDCDTVFFIGISLNYDLDIKRVVYQADLDGKAFFILHTEESQTTIKRVKKLGEPLCIGVKKFSQDIKHQLKEIKVANTEDQVSYEAFRPITKILDRPEITDEKIRDLLIYGNVQDDCLQFSAIEPIQYPYCLYRNILEKVERIIDNGGRNIVISGNVGNGKTLFVKSLAYRLTNRGYKVYMLDDVNNGNPQRELESLSKNADKRSVVIIESYTSHKDLLSLFKAFRGDMPLIVTERSSLNDIHIDWLRELLDEDFSYYSLDRLDDTEIENLIDFLNEIDVWGDLAVTQNWKKRKFLTDDCNCELRSVLIRLLETKPILDRLRTMVGKIENNGSFYKSLIMVLLSSYADFKTDIYELASAIDQELMCNTSFTRNDTIKEFINFSTGRTKATSSILAEVILKKIIDPKKLINTIVEIFNKLDRYSYQTTKGALIKLMTFSTLHTILAPHLGSKADKEIANFYSKIRECRICKKNAHYWLQYAIAMVEVKDFPSALVYFKNAYSYASDRTKFSHVQIDNHYARYLLENALVNEDDHFLDSFLKAHALLLNPLFLKETKYYPFKVAITYPDFYAKYVNKMGIEQLTLFKEKVTEMLAQLNKYRESVGKNGVRRDVLEAERGLKNILEDKKQFKK